MRNIEIENDLRCHKRNSIRIIIGLVFLMCSGILPFLSTASVAADYITGQAWFVSNQTARNASPDNPAFSITPANATFKLSGINFDSRSGYNGYTLRNFLTNAGAHNIAYSQGTNPDRNLSNGSTTGTLFKLTGTAYFTKEQSLTVQHDDGVTVIVNGQTVISAPGPTSPTTSTGTYTGETGNWLFTFYYGECDGPPAVLKTTLVTQVSTNLAVSAASGTYGGTTTLSATLTAGGSPLSGSGKTITFTLNGTIVGSATTDTSGSATLSSVSLAGINAGTYANGVGASFAGDGPYLASAGTAALTISPASSTTTVSCPSTPQTYTGSPIEVCTASVSGVGGLNQSLTVNYTNNTNAGTATASASFDGDANHNGSSDSKNFTIDQASSTTIVTCGAGPFTYDGTAQTPCSASVSGVGGLNQSLTVNYTNNTNAGTATASASFAGDANHNGSSDSKNFTIDKATPIITWDNPADITYPTVLGDAQLNATADVPGLFIYNPTSCTVLSPGNGWSLKVTFTPSDEYKNNYNGASKDVNINVLAPKVTKEQIGDLWICTQSDASGYPVAMYTNCNKDDDCSVCMDPLKWNLNRCGNSPLSDVAFLAGKLKWVGPGSETVDFVTSDTIYRCIEGIDLCFSCGGDSTWSCDPSIPNLLSIPAVNTTAQEKIADVWVCAESPNPLSGCFETVYSCPDATDQNPCLCVPGPTNTWPLSTLSNVAFLAGQLKWVGPGSDNLNCETVYFVTTSCIYKCISDTGDCFVYPQSCAQ